MSRELEPVELVKMRDDQDRVERDFWASLKRVLRRVPFIDDLLAVYFCAMDPATPARVKAVLLGALAYFVMPVDLIPDFVALLGYGDDAAVLYAAIRTVGPHIRDRHREAARVALDRLLWT
jgi:uncharacterized membrane protein YkvA (DUF1232 family)